MERNKEFDKKLEDLRDFANKSGIPFVSISYGQVVSVSSDSTDLIISICCIVDLACKKLTMSPKKFLRAIRTMVESSRQKTNEDDTKEA